MPKNIWLGLATILALTIAFTQSSKAQSINRVDSIVEELMSRSEQKVKVSFSEPISVSEVERISYQYGFLPEEFSFEIENPYGETVYGGYQLDGSLTLPEAVADFKQKHEAFYQEAIEALAADIRIKKDTMVVAGLKKLRNQFIKLSEEYERDGLKLNSMTIKKGLSLDLIPNDGRFEKIEIVNSKAKTETPLDKSAEATWYSWQPNRGSSKVNKSITFQVFYFNNLSAFRSSDTYEHETQIYNTNFANYANYYSTNLPSGYKDTQFLDGGIDNFAVGTPYASQLKINTQYYTSMSLSPQSAATATVRIKGQKGYRSPSFCSSTWCIFPSATTDSLVTFTAPISYQKSW